MFQLHNIIQVKVQLMKALYIDTNQCNEIELIDNNRNDEYQLLLDKFDLMESYYIYFSAGDTKIKETLIKKDPTFSA